jgi:hypothetical protein
MRTIGVTIVAILALWVNGFAQEQAVRFSVEVSTDSLLMDNPLQVSFTLENGAGNDFQAPLFNGFSVVSGPNVSSSMSIVNGAVTQSKRFTFLLMPERVGNFFIEPASVTVEGTVLETLPVEIIVVPNPDGIQQAPTEQRLGFGGFHSFPSMPEGNFFEFGPDELRQQMEEFGFDLNQMEFPSFDWEQFDFPGFNWESFPAEPPAQQEQPQKKKRKTYKL